MNTARATIVLALLLQGFAAAACANREFVTGPTTATRVPAAISLSGVVYDTAHRPLSGARVEVTDGVVGDWCHYSEQPAPACIVAAFTDGEGRFKFSGSAGGSTTFGSVTRLRASMEGYLSATLAVDSTSSNGAIEFRLEPSVTR